MITGFVYRFKNKNNEIIYIGETGKDLYDRFIVHAHLIKKMNYKEVFKIEYIPVYYRSKYTRWDMEKYYIRKFKPKYNTAYKNQSNSTDILQLNNYYWKTFNDGDYNIGWLPESAISKEREECWEKYHQDIFNNSVPQNKICVDL